ncbi:multidrug efflux SMR transporter [Roseobacter sp. HKCCA0434]|uniref:DMT family transporter n=1 Tax=Roseobacter sp. HKCCA0434 TaxID=3079297 RepID=UPI002905B2B1|nr:multidrug efflux SMR transporter [Roseobacter sp. HKCCA0434]
MPWILLIVAIAGEVIGTTALKASDGFTRLGPGLVAFAGYAVAFWFLAQVLRTIPVGIAYAIWSGVGIAAMAVIGRLAFGQKLDPAGLVGIGLIAAGVLVINTLSNSGH